MGHTLTYREIVRIVLLAGGVVVFLAALNLAFGMPQPGPLYEIIPDPAGPLPF
jgi:hypothetical protein